MEPDKLIQEYQAKLSSLSSPTAVDKADLAGVGQFLSQYGPAYQAAKRLIECQRQIDQAKQMMTQAAGDDELTQLAREELRTLQDKLEDLQSRYQQAIKLAQTADNGAKESIKQVTIEVKPGVGGDEAKIWASDLIRMYQRYAESLGFKASRVEELVLVVKGRGVYQIFEYEAGVHRVQRVPVTESQGRLHTSTASVAVIPEVPRSQVVIRDEDLEWQFFRSGGHGGQNVNKVNTAVRLTHKPSGLVVTCQRERSQQQNRLIALELLRGRLWQIEEAKRRQAIEAKRRQDVGRGMRAEKIRTYNFPQNRVTDHRISRSWYNLEEILNGKLAEITKALQQNLKEA